MFSFLNTNNIISFLILIFPAALVSGPFIPEIINFFFLLYLLYLLYNNEDLKILKPAYINFFILVNFYLLINSIISYINFGNEIVFKYSVFFFRYGLLVFITAYILKKKPELIKLFFIFYSCAFLLIFIDELKQIITQENFFGMKLVGERASSFFGDELILGSFLVRNLPIFIAISFYLKKNNYLILFFLICYGVAIFFAGSRTSFFMYLLFIFFITFYLFKNKLHIFIFYLFLFTTTIFGFFNTPQGQRIFFNTVSQISQNQSNSLKIFSIRHQAHYETALNIFKDNLIFGSGPNLFRFICNENKYYPKKTLKFKYTYLPSEPNVYLYVFDKRYNKKIKIDNSIFLKEGLDKIKLKIENIYKILEINNNQKNYEIEIKINSKQKKILQTSYILGPDDEILISKKYNENDIIINNLSKNYAYKDGCNTHPHNFHLQILSEIGIIGYLFLLFFLVHLMIIYFKNLKFRENIKNYKVQNILIIGILINFFPFMPSGSFFNNWMSFVIFFPIGFLLYFRYLDNNG